MCKVWDFSIIASKSVNSGKIYQIAELFHLFSVITYYKVCLVLMAEIFEYKGYILTA